MRKARQGSSKQWAEIGREMRSIRQKMGLTVTQMAFRTGRPSGTVSDYERGISAPTHDFIDQASAVLCVSEDTNRRWNELRASRSRRWTEERRRAHRQIFMDRTDVGRSQVTALRVSRGMTIAMLAGACEINDSRLCAIEVGRLSPRAGGTWRREAVAIATYFDASCEELWPDHVPPEPRLPSPEGPPTPEELAIESETLRIVMDSMASLPERERAILERHVGLHGDEELLKDIGASFGFSRERARQLAVRAMLKVRAAVAERSAERIESLST